MSERDWLGHGAGRGAGRDREQLERVHTAAHVDSIEELSERGGGLIDLDTVASAGSWEAALHAAGGAVHADRAAPRRRAASPSAVCGPPGHHAERRSGDGLLPLQQRRGRLGPRDRGAAASSASSCSTGTSTTATAPRRSSTTRPEVLYSSIHQSPLYPGPGPRRTSAAATARATRSTCRCRPARAPTSSCPSSKRWSRPIAREWRPGLLCISAGYDAHRDDPLANCELDDAAFGGHGGDDARPRRRARRPGADLPGGRLLARRPLALRGRHARRVLATTACRGPLPRSRGTPIASASRASGPCSTGPDQTSSFSLSRSSTFFENAGDRVEVIDRVEAPLALSVGDHPRRFGDREPEVPELLEAGRVDVVPRALASQRWLARLRLRGGLGLGRCVRLG